VTTSRKLKALLPSTSSGGVDRPTPETDPSQTGHVRMTGSMGNKIRRVWVTIQT
jgi:hypothetical protein